MTTQPAADGASQALPGLAARLRSGTHALHTEVERTGVMHALLHGQLDRAGYHALLRNLHAVYAALEPALSAHATHPWLAPVMDTALFRGDALAADLNELHGPLWTHELPVCPAAEQYGQRLRALAHTSPQLLVAHAYVRYLGDLSGGQALRRIVATRFGLAPGSGVRFYEFGDTPRVSAMKRNFRDGLARVPADAEGIDTIIAEARAGFGLHRAMFSELANGSSSIAT